MNITVNALLDAKGLACPMPIVKTKKVMKDLAAGEVIEVQATDQGSTADLKAWAESMGHQYLGTIEENDVLKHYLRKASEAEIKEETTYEIFVDQAELLKKIELDEKITIIDVREPAEFIFGHIPNAINISIGELEERTAEIPNEPLFIICRTGSRSDLAAKKLTEKGFKDVINVVPGMSTWTGPIEVN